MWGNNDNKKPPAGNPNQPPPAEKTKSFLFVCTAKCTYQGSFFREGETIVLPEEKEVPHFKLVEELKQSG
jgi:hypothetical protein